MDTNIMLRREGMLLILLAINMFLRLSLVHSVAYNPDEGSFVFDAGLVAERGLVPIADFNSRSPVFMYSVAFFMALFGKGMFVGRLVSLVAVLATSVVLYHIGKRLFTADVGLVAAFLYLFTPLSLYGFTPLLTQPVALFWVAVAVYYLLSALEWEDHLHYLASGLALGLAVLCRLSAAFLLPFFVAYLFLRKHERVSHVPGALAMAAGAILPGLLFTAYLVASVGPMQAYIGFLQPPSQDYSFVQGVPSLLKTLALEIVAADYTLFFLALFAVLMNVRKVMPGTWLPESVLNPLYTVVQLAALGFVLLYLLAPASLLGSLQSLLSIKKTSFFFEVTGFLVIAASGVLFLLRYVSRVPRESLDTFHSLSRAHLLPLLWLAGPLAFYGVYFIILPRMHPWYVLELLPPLCLIGALSASHLYHRWGGLPHPATTLLAVFICLLFLSSAMSTHVAETDPQRTLSIEKTQAIAAHLQRHTLPTDAIFTPLIPYAIEADRPLALGIGHPSLYRFSFTVEEYSLFQLPTPDDVIAALSSGDIPYVVVDDYEDSFTHRSLYANHPDIQKAIEDHYVTVATTAGPYPTNVMRWRERP